MQIRKVNENDDFNAIGDIYAQSWKTAYKGIVPQEHLDGLKGERWAGFLSARENPASVIVEDGKYIGTLSVCPAREEKMAGWGEIISIYLLPEHFGKGGASPLLEAGVKELADMGFEKIYLWVLEENTRARRFYEKHGFYHNGDMETITIGGKDLTEIRYVRVL